MAEHCTDNAQRAIDEGLIQKMFLQQAEPKTLYDRYIVSFSAFVKGGTLLFKIFNRFR